MYSAEAIVERLENGNQPLRYEFVHQLAYAFGLHMRCIAFAADQGANQLEQLKGCAEVFHRIFEHMRDSSCLEERRPQHDFIQILLSLAEHHGIQGEVGGALTSAMQKTVRPN